MFMGSERDDTRRNMMRNKLLATVAMTALIGCTSFAVAQNAGTQGGTMQSPGAQQQHQMGGPSGGSAQNESTPPKSTPKGEQGKSFSQENKSQPGTQGSASAPKGEQGKSFSQENKSQPGAQGSASAPKTEQGKSFSQENKSQPGAQGSAQEQRGSPNQRGAQEQRGKDEQRGAQIQHEERGAQDKDRAGVNGTQERAQERTQERTQERMGQDQDRGKAFQGQAQQNGGVTTGRSGRASVQLSEDQRTKIKGIIVRDRNVARVNSANFSVSVGAKVPRDVHVTVLPSEVVMIVPEYRGYDYVLIGDQLLIIDPDTMEIVAILPA
jgi:hypothetical protein